MAGWATLWLGAIALARPCSPSHRAALHRPRAGWPRVAAVLVVAPLVAWAGTVLTARWSRTVRALTDGITSIKDRDFSMSVTRVPPG